MSKLVSSLVLIGSIFSYSMHLCADEEIAIANTSNQMQPQVTSKFYSAEAIYIIPRLKYLDAADPGFNKLVFTLNGYPKNTPIVADIKRLSSNDPNAFQPLFSFTILDDNSYLINTQPPQKLNEIVVSSRGFLPGERVTYRFHTTDGSVNKEVSGIPAPLDYKDDSGKVVVRAELLSIDPTAYALDFPQMNEGEEFEIKSSSLGETATATVNYTKEKPFHYSPSAGKAAGGVAVLEIKVKSGDVYLMKMPWGTALDAHLSGQKPHLYH